MYLSNLQDIIDSFILIKSTFFSFFEFLLTIFFFFFFVCIEWYGIINQ